MRRSVRQERKIAREAGGRRTAGSGNQPGNKGDVRTDRWLVEAKTTTAKGYTVTMATWRKIELEAHRKLLEPALIIEIDGRQLVIVDYHAWLSLM